MGTRRLTRHTALHSDPNDPQHEADKAEKNARIKIAYTSVPAFALEAGGSLSMRFDLRMPLKGNGTVYRFGASQAENDLWASCNPRKLPPLVAHHGAAGRELVLGFAKLAEERRRYRAKVIENGREHRKSRKIPERGSGAVQLVSTCAPWQVPVLRKLSQEDFLEYTEGVAMEIAETIKRVSGRNCWGCAVHHDTKILHFEHSVPATFQTENGWEKHPKGTFLNLSDWQLGTLRINEQFPDLLPAKDVRDAQSYFDKRNGREIVNWEVSKALDQYTEDFIARKRLLSEYAEARERYQREKEVEMQIRWRARVLEDSAQRCATAPAQFTSKAVRYLGRTVFEFVDAALWRAIPREVRLPLALALKVYKGVQSVRKAEKTPEEMVVGMLVDVVEGQLRALRNKRDFLANKPEAPTMPGSTARRRKVNR